MADDDKTTPREIASRKELQRLKLDRRNDPPVPFLNHPRPAWADNADDPVRRQIRMRERRIRKLENRLDGAVKKMERDFDQSV